MHSYFKQAGITHKIKYHIGKAVDVIPQLDEVFDLVFMDVDFPAAFSFCSIKCSFSPEKVDYCSVKCVQTYF